MYKYAILAAAFAAAAEATFVIGTTAAATTGTAVTITSATATSLALLGGVALLKGVVLAAALSRRGKRSADKDEQDAAFALIASTEPAQCYRRLICDLSAGALADKDQITTLFVKEVSPISPKFEFATAAKVGSIAKSAQICELRYSCPLNTQEIQKLFN